MAFRKKKGEILEHDPDIAVIQECENPATKGDWSEFSDWEWVGNNDNKGLGIFVRNGASIDSIAEKNDKCQYFLPVKITGSVDVLGVWAMNNETNPEKRYIGQVYTALQQYQDFVDSNTVVAGDFNWNVQWDESPKSPLCGNFEETVDILNEIGLSSSYHHVTGSEFGDEDDPTFFMHKKQNRPYHTDYLFLPEKLNDSIDTFSVGEYQDWTEASDHMPIMAELNTE